MDTATIRSRVLERAAQPRGFAIPDLPTCNPSTVHTMCCRLQAEGLLFKAKLSHRVVKWFTDKDRALQAEDMARADKGRRHEKMADLKPRLRDNTPAIVPEGVKHTVYECKAVPRYAGHVGAVAFGLQRGRVSS